MLIWTVSKKLRITEFGQFAKLTKNLARARLHEILGWQYILYGKFLFNLIILTSKSLRDPP